MLLKATNRNSQSDIVGNLRSVGRPAFLHCVGDQTEEDCKMSRTSGAEERSRFSDGGSKNRSMDVARNTEKCVSACMINHFY